MRPMPPRRPGLEEFRDHTDAAISGSRVVRHRRRRSQCSSTARHAISSCQLPASVYCAKPLFVAPVRHVNLLAHPHSRPEFARRGRSTESVSWKKMASSWSAGRTWAPSECVPGGRGNGRALQMTWGQLSAQPASARIGAPQRQQIPAEMLWPGIRPRRAI